MVRTPAIFYSIAIFCLVSVLIFVSVSSADPDMDLNALPEETPVARVLDRTITLGDINPSQDMIDQYGADMTAEQMAEWKAQIRQSKLGNCLRPLFERYAEQSEISVTDAEIEEFNQALLQITERQLNKVKAIAGSLEKELQAKNLDDAVRDELTEQFEMYSGYIKNRENREEERALYQGIGSSAAGTVIRQWKIDQQLYKQYGGRVIFQQAGPEPLDAYRKFMEERQQQGDFEFYNEQAADLFWEYYRNDKMHTVYSDAAEAKKMMETPWWLQESEETLYQEDLDLWGDCTDGLCTKIKPGKMAFTNDQDVTVMMDLLNIGRQTYSCASPEQFFEIEVDGKWYGWSGPEPSDVSPVSAGPDTIRNEFATLVLTDQWRSIEDNTPLALDEGTHYMRVRYQPLSIVKSETSPQKLAPTFWATSNLQTFRIIERPLGSRFDNVDDTDLQGQVIGFAFVEESHKHNSYEGYDAAYGCFEVEYEYNGDEEAWIGGAVYNDRYRVSRGCKPAMIHSGKNVAEVRILVVFKEDDPDTKESNEIEFTMYNSSGGRSISRRFDYDKIWSGIP